MESELLIKEAESDEFPAFMAFTPKETSDRATRAQYHCDILATREKRNDKEFLVRLTLDSVHKYCVKTGSAFDVLFAKLKGDSESGWGDADQQVTVVPEEYLERQFGGNSNKGTQEEVAAFLQKGLSVILVQVTEIEKVTSLNSFFSCALTEDLLESDACAADWVKNVRSQCTLMKIVGYWAIENSRRLWTIYADGRAYLDGRYLGPEYDLVESGDNLKRTISRGDGWSVDLDAPPEKSLFWTSPGHPTVRWRRVKTADARERLKTIAEKAEKNKNTEGL